MKLFVAGATSPTPDDWSGWDEYSLVLAESIEQAETLTGKTPIFEVDMSKPALLCSHSEPNWGEDL